MKPISEYNFREIVGEYLIVENTSIDPNHNKYIGYCYIDTEAGISIRIVGKYIEEEHVVELSVDKLYIFRYDSDMMIEIFNGTNEALDAIKDNIDAIYMRTGIESLRDNIEYDPYRDKQFPDDMLLVVATLIENNIEFELLWVRPLEINENGNVFGQTIEGGRIISEGTNIAIMNSKILGGKEIFDLPNIIAIDQNVANYLAEKIQEEKNV